MLSRQSYPRLPEEDQKTIALYLGWYQLLAQQALEKATASYKRHPDVVGFKRQMEYWDDVVSACKWMLLHVGHRQKYLEIERCLKLGIQPDPTPEPGH